MSMDFQRPAIDSIISRGEQAAMEKWDELIALKESLGLEDSSKIERENKNPYIHIDTLIIDNIRIEGVSPVEEKQILRWISVKENRVTRKDLDGMTSRIYASGLFSRVYYRLDRDQPFDLCLSKLKESNTLNMVHTSTPMIWRLFLPIQQFA